MVSDTLAFSTGPDGSGVPVAFSANESGTFAFSGPSGGSCTFSQREVIRGTNRADSFNASAITNGVAIDGGAGNDTLHGGMGSDTLLCRAGLDVFALADGSKSDMITDFDM